MRPLEIVRHLSSERRAEVYRATVEMSTPGRSYYAMVALSSIIASYGLLADSIAVVIGAMLVAPLMGPIFGIALGLESGDRHLLRTAALSELGGIVLAVGLGALIGLLPLRMAFGHEILARTEPTLYDIIIALASGMAGAYALVDKRISPALPGVAIATALMPPLAVTGLCLATGRWSGALGASLLFFASFLAVELAASVVLALKGMGAQEQQQAKTKVSGFLRRFGWSLAALAVMSAYMTSTLTTLITNNRLNKSVETVLSREIAATAGAQLSEVNVDRREGALDVMVTALTPSEFEPEQVAAMEKSLRESVNPRIKLIVRSLISKDADARGPVFTVTREGLAAPKPDEEAVFLTQASQVIEQKVAQTPGAHLVDLRREEVAGQTVLTAVVRTPAVIEPQRVGLVEKALWQATGQKVRLVVRSVPVWDADAEGFVDGTHQAAAPLGGSVPAELEARLRSALARQVAAQVAGARVVSLSVGSQKGRMEVVVAVRTPANLGPAQVKAIQGNLRKYVRPDIDLLVRSMVGTYASDSGYPEPPDAPAVGGP